MITATLLPTKITWFIFDSILLIGLLILSRLPLKQFSRDLRFWLIFVSILFLFQAFFTHRGPNFYLPVASYKPGRAPLRKPQLLASWAHSQLCGPFYRGHPSSRNFRIRSYGFLNLSHFSQDAGSDSWSLLPFAFSQSFWIKPKKFNTLTRLDWEIRSGIPFARPSFLHFLSFAVHFLGQKMSRWLLQQEAIGMICPPNSKNYRSPI